MSIWRQLLHNLGLRRSEDSVLRFDQTLISALQVIAEREQRPAEEVAADLLTDALRQRQTAEEQLQRWRNLSPREQQVAALISLNYANAEIAARLNISLPTVKAHVRNILRKFNLPRRADLRHALADWDFSAWK